MHIQDVDHSGLSNKITQPHSVQTHKGVSSPVIYTTLLLWLCPSRLPLHS